MYLIHLCISAMDNSDIDISYVKIKDILNIPDKCHTGPFPSSVLQILWQSISQPKAWAIYPSPLPALNFLPDLFIKPHLYVSLASFLTALFFRPITHSYPVAVICQHVV